MEVLSQRYRRTNDSAQVEDTPEDPNELALLAFSSIGQHHGALSGPEQTSTDTKNSTSSDNKTTSMWMNVQRSRFDGLVRG